MKLFLSHANADLYLAQALKLRLAELSDELDCFMFADDISNEPWEDRIRGAARECDGVVSVVSKRYLKRPWFIAEWAAFWLQEKPWYPLLYKVEPGELFEPMRRRQAYSLTDRLAVERFLESLPVTPAAGRPPDLVSDELVKAVARADAQQTSAATDAVLADLAETLEGEGSRVEHEAIEAACQAGRLAEILALVARSENSVALRKLGSSLVRLGQLEAAGVVAARTPNLSECRTIGLRVLDLLKQEPGNPEAEELRLQIYGSVRDPQRRDLRKGALERGLELDWPELPPNP